MTAVPEARGDGYEGTVPGRVPRHRVVGMGVMVALVGAGAAGVVSLLPTLVGTMAGGVALVVLLAVTWRLVGRLLAGRGPVVDGHAGWPLAALYVVQYAGAVALLPVAGDSADAAAVVLGVLVWTMPVTVLVGRDGSGLHRGAAAVAVAAMAVPPALLVAYAVGVVGFFIGGAVAAAGVAFGLGLEPTMVDALAVGTGLLLAAVVGHAVTTTAATFVAASTRQLR